MKNILKMMILSSGFGLVGCTGDAGGGDSSPTPEPTIAPPVQGMNLTITSEDNKVINTLDFSAVGEHRIINYTFYNQLNESYYTPKISLDGDYILYMTRIKKVTGFSDSFIPTTFVNNGESDNCLNKPILNPNESCTYQTFFYVDTNYSADGESETPKLFTPYKYSMKLVSDDSELVVSRCSGAVNTTLDCSDYWATQLESLGLYNQIHNIPNGKFESYINKEYYVDGDFAYWQVAYSYNGLYQWQCWNDKYDYNTATVRCEQFNINYNRSTNTLIQSPTPNASVALGFDNFAHGMIVGATSFQLLPLYNGSSAWIKAREYNWYGIQNTALPYSDLNPFSEPNGAYVTADNSGVMVTGLDNSFWVGNTKNNPESTYSFINTNISNISSEIIGVFPSGIVLSSIYSPTSTDYICWTYSKTDIDGTLIYESAPVEFVDEPYVYNPNATYKPGIFIYGEFSNVVNINNVGTALVKYNKVVEENNKCIININQYFTNQNYLSPLLTITQEWVKNGSGHITYPSQIYGLQ